MSTYIIELAIRGQLTDTASQCIDFMINDL